MATTENHAAPRVERLVGIGITWKLAGQIAIQLMRLATVAVLARLLTPSDYGAAAIAVAFAAFAPTVADMGIGSSLVQTKTADRVVRSTAFWASVGFGTALFLLAAALSRPIESLLGEPGVAGMVTAGGLTFALYAVGSTSMAIFTRDMRFRSIELRNWFGLFVGAVAAIIAAALGAGAWALVLQQIIYIGTVAVTLWLGAGWRPHMEFSRAVFRDLTSFAVRIAGGRWARLLELVVLSLMIGKLVSVADLGAWTFAMSMVVLPLSLIAIPTAEVLFSAFSRLRNEPERMSALWLDSIAYLAAVMLPLLLGLMVVSPDLIPVVFGEQWHVSVGVIQILSLYVLIRSLQSWGSVYMDAVGRPEVTFWTQLVSLCLTPVAVLIGVNWGINGVAVCFLIAQMIAVEIPMFVIVLRHMRLGVRPIVSRLAGITGAAMIMTGACLLARSAFAQADVGAGTRAALTTVVGAAVFAPALRWLAPHVSRRLTGIVVSRLAKLLAARRQRGVLQPERG